MPTVATVAGGALVTTQSFNQLIDVLQALPGSTDTGRYFIEGNNYATTSRQSCFVTLRSRGVVPVSMSLDTTDNAPTRLGTPVASHFSSAGIRVQATGTAINAVSFVGGGYVIQY